MQKTFVLQGCDGSFWNLSGESEGAEGVCLDTDPIGLYDPPVKVVYEEPGNFPGARYRWHRILRRDLTIPVVILNDPEIDRPWDKTDSKWRRAWSFRKDSILYCHTEEDGIRGLKCRLGGTIKVDLSTDPDGRQLNTAKFDVIAGDPFWWGADQTITKKTTMDTRVTGTEEITFTVVDPNPTDQPIFPKWTLEAPTGSNPAIRYTIPDYGWADNPSQATRRIGMPLIYVADGNVLVDSDPRVEQVSSKNNTPIWNRMNGVRFRNYIPEYTLGTYTFQVTVTGAPANTEFQLRLPRPWSRPWGLSD